MTADMVKEIAVALGTLGDDAKEAFIWYMIALTVSTLITYTLPAVAIVGVAAIIARTVRYLVTSLCASDRLRRAFGASGDSDGWSRAADIVCAEEVLRAHRLHSVPCEKMKQYA